MKYNIINTGKKVITGVTILTMLSSCATTNRVGYNGLSLSNPNTNSYQTIDNMCKLESSAARAYLEAKAKLGNDAIKPQVVNQAGRERSLEKTLAKTKLGLGATGKAAVVGGTLYLLYKGLKDCHDGKDGLPGKDGKDGVYEPFAPDGFRSGPVGANTNSGS